MLKDKGRKGYSPIGVILKPSLNSPFAILFQSLPLYPCVYIMFTWLSFDSADSFSMQSAVSDDFIPLVARAVIAALPSVQIVICSFTSLLGT